ncbi:hypothetical protein T4A_13547 [Trichinella pseudospiralis]|uniref:Uncharacterized protein n=1 Tax=Trichinella pseudospiralis TaxID=6337 RepID=A0A0V1EXG4_TRIPS|nr:hypothetical protein T4A_13547 [Trichinella pseudospiralis]
MQMLCMDFGKDKQTSKEPLDTRVVMKMVDFISANSAVQAHLCLLVKLADIGMRAIGTVGQSRAAGAITLMSVRYCPFEKHQESTAKVYVAKWLDNSVIASNRHVHNQLHKLLDRSPKKRHKSGRPHLLIQHWSFGLRPLPLIFWISCHQHLG